VTEEAAPSLLKRRREVWVTSSLSSLSGCLGEDEEEGGSRVCEASSSVVGSKGLVWEMRMFRNSSSKRAMAIWMAELTFSDTETEERDLWISSTACR